MNRKINTKKGMKIGIIVSTAIFIFAGIVVGTISAQDNISNQDFQVQDNLSSQNYTKLDIIPQYSNVRLQPGENKEIVVTVRNRNDRTVNINTRIETQNGYMNPSWITVNPSITNIPAGESKKFTINVSAPSDASIGTSGIQIIFTNDIIPTPYPQPMPAYANVLQLSVDIYTQPKLQIETPYINGQLEAGKSYEYDVKVKNIGNYAINISPRLGTDMYIDPNNPGPILDEKSITIDAPQSISAGKIETIKINIKIPGDAIGYYNNYIDLGADDPSIMEGQGRISLGLNIWKQPKDPFVKNFKLDKKSQITVEISSSSYNNPVPVNGLKEPSFDTSVVGPDGEADLHVTKAITKGNVNMGGNLPILSIDNESTYQETGTQYVYTYKTDGSPGKWKLKVTPKNVPGFDYSITTENK